MQQVLWLRGQSRSPAEPLAGDLASRPSLRAALAGCWGAFGIVPSAGSTEAGVDPGRNLVHAVAGSELEHLVLGFPPGAARLEAYARSLGLPATYVRIGLLPAAAAEAPGEQGDLLAEIFERPGDFVGRSFALEDAEALLT